MPKLRNFDREMLRNTVVARATAELRAERKATHDELVEALRKLMVPADVEKFVSKVPPQFLSASSSLAVALNGEREWVALDEDDRLRAGWPTDARWYAVPDGSPAAKLIERRRDIDGAIKIRTTDMENMLRGVLAQCNTTTQLLKAWPEVAQLAPEIFRKEPPTTAVVPVSLVRNLNAVLFAKKK